MPKYLVSAYIRPADPEDYRFWALDHHESPPLSAAQARDVAHEMIRMGYDRADELLDGAELLAPDFDLDTGIGFDQIANCDETDCTPKRKPGHETDAASDLERMFGAAAATVVATGMAILRDDAIVLNAKKLARPLWETFLQVVSIRADHPRDILVGDQIWSEYENLYVTVIYDEQHVPLAFMHDDFGPAPVVPCDGQGDWTPKQFAFILYQQSL